MKQPRMHRAYAPRREGGFTLLEVMIVVAIVGILAGIALPTYQTFIMRSRIIEATTALGDIRSQMEKYYMDNRTYVAGGGGCGVTSYAPDPIAAFNGVSKNFQVTCPAASLTATTYLLVATGQGPMVNFQYSVDNTNAKLTVSVPTVGYPAWSGSGNACWVTRTDGSCD